jgi:glycine/D-amino acid oxidase-like deaminating enzyme
MNSLAVVGMGISGLAAAYLLSRRPLFNEPWAEASAPPPADALRESAA